MTGRNEALWPLLSDEELAECSDQWRYSADYHRQNGQYGLARFAERMSNEAYEVLNQRHAEAAARRTWGEQLMFTEREYRRVFDPGA